VTTASTERKATAWHEAGHAVIAYRLGVEIIGVTIVPYREYAGSCLRLHTDPERAIQIALAGSLAETRISPDDDAEYDDGDYDTASGLARDLAGSDGARELLRHMERSTRRLVDQHWAEIERVALALLNHDLLTGLQVKNIIEDRPISFEPDGRAKPDGGLMSGLLQEEHDAERSRWAEAMQDEEADRQQDEAEQFELPF
jgi:hypothetical protein